MRIHSSGFLERLNIWSIFSTDQRRSQRHSAPHRTDSPKFVESVPIAQGCLHRGKADNQVFSGG